MKFRKKPVVIDAFRWTGHNMDEAFKFLGAESLNTGMEGWLEIETLEGTMRANPGDWIIKGVKGEFYPCKPDIFEATYETTDDV